MNKLMFSAVTVVFFASSAFAADKIVCKKHFGGTIISVTSTVKIKPVTAIKSNSNQRVLFDYGLENKKLSKSEREYREFLSLGTYSRVSSSGSGSYRNVRGGGYSGGVGGRVVATKEFNPRRSSTGRFASLSNSNGRGRFGSLSNGNRFATLGRGNR